MQDDKRRMIYVGGRDAMNKYGRCIMTSHRVCRRGVGWRQDEKISQRHETNGNMPQRQRTKTGASQGLKSDKEGQGRAAMEGQHMEL